MTQDFISHGELVNAVDFERHEKSVENLLQNISTDEMLLRFLIEYASWNGYFAAGVVGLAAEIGCNRQLFVEEGFRRHAADRSTLVASYIFEAARDEFDDSINNERDPHRSLSQVTLIAAADYLDEKHSTTRFNEMLDQPDGLELDMLNMRVIQGYCASSNNSVTRTLNGIGYHLGSEILADREFTIIDRFLRQNYNDLVQRLMRTTVTLGDATHRAYAWIGIHSQLGGGVEQDHFEAALEGANKALEYSPADDRARRKGLILNGFKTFAEDHRTFFEGPSCEPLEQDF